MGTSLDQSVASQLEEHIFKDAFTEAFMNTTNAFCSHVWKELEGEAAASRKCLERIPENLFGWKPHERSMQTGYLALLVAEIPKWIQYTVETTEIDFATFQHEQPKTTADLVNHFDENMQKAKQALERASDEILKDMFYLKNSGQV